MAETQIPPAEKPEVLIRPLEPSDLPRLEQMYRDFEPRGSAKGLPPVREEKTARWLHYLGERGHSVVAVDAKGTIVGHAVLADSADREAELAVFIRQEQRVRGIGTRLAGAMVEFAKKNHYRRLWATVSAANRPAIRMVETCGFRICPGPWTGDIELELLLDDGRQTA